jgi:ethanolamine utilization microcompartment shell protein EutL
MKTMRTVQIADDVYAALQQMAVPFEDDINDVLRRLLKGSSRANGTAPPRAAPISAEASEPAVNDSNTVVVHRREVPNGARIPQSTYRAAVLGILRAHDGPVALSDVLPHVERQLKDRMTDDDREVLATGVSRWQSHARNALTQLQYEGRAEDLGDGRYRYRDNGHPKR